MNSTQLHKMLNQRKKKKDEKLPQYFLHMKAIALRGNIDNLALIQYAIPIELFYTIKNLKKN